MGYRVLAFCVISLYLQILSGSLLVTIQDWSALMDIRSSVVLAVTILLIVTFILNIVSLMLRRTKSND